jgi:hypothetical protein
VHVLIASPWSIVGGWLVLFAWGALQLAWYRRARVMPAVVQPSAPPRTPPARARTPKADHTIVQTLPPIDLDSITDTNVVAPVQTVLGL